MAAPQNPVYPPPPYYVQPRKSRWWIPVLIIGIILVFFLAIFITAITTIGSVFKKEPFEVKANSVLYLNLTKAVSEAPVSNPLGFLEGGTGANFFDILQAIKNAKTDTKIKGIYYKASGTPMGFAKTKELLETLDDFKKSGKFIYAYIETGTENDYLKALPADKIFMPKEGMIEMNGFGISGMFLKGLFDKVGIEFYVEHFEDFKSAGESFNRKKFSDSARKNLRDILDQRLETFVDYVAHYRNIEPKTVIAALNRGIYTPDSMLALHFIDTIASESELKDMMKAKIFGSVTNDDLRLVSVDNYGVSDKDIPNVKIDTKNSIAVIYASGSIVSKGSENLLSSDNAIVASKYVKYLKQAREDNKVKAIVLRIDSPGGSVIASDDIYNEILKTKKVKPVYASMSDVAASGGYYIAMACDTIVAEPQTITGSIGVISIVPNISGMLNKLDITIDTLSTGPSAQDLNLNLPFTQHQKTKLAGLMEQTYKRFVQKVADARKKRFEDTRAIAKGRVWTGVEAQKLGLVDMLGGLQTTLDLAKKRIGIPTNSKVLLKEYPSKQDEFEFFRKLLRLSDDDNENSSGDVSLLAKNDNFKAIYSTLPLSMKLQVNYIASLLNMSSREKVLMAMPVGLEFE